MKILAPALASAFLVAAPAFAAEEPLSYGVWTNPHHSVQVHIHSCGNALCGTVVWASAKAQADARKGGTEKLIGAELFTDFTPAGPAGEMTWRGKVFVPDLGKTLSGTVTRVNGSTLRAEGCLLGKILCKSQEWTRVEAPAS